MTTFLKSRFAWVTAPVIFIVWSIILLCLWAFNAPEWIQTHFDADGASPIESATVGFFYLLIGLIWLVPTMRPSKRALFWKVDFSLVALIAICRELDWHKLLVHASDLPGATHGTAFKMKFITNPANPLGDRILVVVMFLLFFAVLGGTLIRFLPRLVKGLFKLHPVCWSIGFLGGTGILVNIFDRTPSILRKRFGTELTDSTAALMTAFEEGMELLLPIFAMVAILQAYRIYVADADEGTLPAEWREI